MARIWCEGSGHHPESSAFLAQVGEKMDTRWRMCSEICSMYAGSKRRQHFPTKCLRGCFSLADGLRTSMKILECSGIVIVIWTPEFSFYHKKV